MAGSDVRAKRLTAPVLPVLVLRVFVRFRLKQPLEHLV